MGTTLLQLLDRWKEITADQERMAAFGRKFSAEFASALAAGQRLLGFPMPLDDAVQANIAAGLVGCGVLRGLIAVASVRNYNDDAMRDLVRRATNSKLHNWELVIIAETLGAASGSMPSIPADSSGGYAPALCQVWLAAFPSEEFPELTQSQGPAATTATTAA